MPKGEIASNDYDLSINRYKEVKYEEVEYDPPMVILERLAVLEGANRRGACGVDGDAAMRWDRIPLGDIALRRGGSVDPKKHQDEVFELYSIPAFDAGAPQVLPGSSIGSSKKVVQPNDVMISRIVPHIRRACVVGPANRHRQIASGEWIILRDERIWPNYLRWLLVGDVFHSAFMRTVSGVGGSLLRARPAEVFKIKIPLPPLDEQKRLAGFLDAAETLRVKRRAALSQLDTLLQSVFVDMFGDLDTNPMRWEKHRIESIFDVARGGSPRPIQAYLTESEDGLNWIMIGDAAEGSRYITSTSKRIKPEGLRKSRKVHEGDLLLTNSMSFGKPYILKTEGCIHDGWLVLRPRDERMSADFFYNLLSTATLYREFKKKAAGAVVKNLNTTLVKQVSVPVPPLDLQHRFAAVVESVERQKARQQAHLAELDTLFASLQSRAFMGDL